MNILVIGFKEDSIIVKNRLKREHQIIGYCDCFYDNCNENEKLFSMDGIDKIQYDYVFVTIRDLELSANVRDILIFEKKVDAHKILEFYRLYQASLPMMRVNRVMENPNYSSYEGMILGISHSEVGIITKYLSKSFCNLSVSSQDLYYNLKTLEYCISNYYDKIRNLKYVIIDMFDYFYFNYDVSLTKNAVPYWSWGGYHLDAHNFVSNKIFNQSFQQVMDNLKSERLDGITEKAFDVWNNLFTNIYSYNNYMDFTNFEDIEKRLQIVKDQDIESYNTEISLVRNRYPKTIDENMETFDKLMKTLKNFNPKLKIYALLIPKYSEIENRGSSNMEAWKKHFEDTLMSFKKCYDFKFYDLKGCTNISSHKMYYQDPTHLNYLGAINFTKYLDRLLQLHI